MQDEEIIGEKRLCDAQSLAELGHDSSAHEDASTPVRVGKQRRV